MYQIMSFIIKLHISNIRREKFLAQFLAVLPTLLNGHVFAVDTIKNASGKVIFIQQKLLPNLGAVMTVVKTHDVTVRRHKAGMLLIWPVEIPLTNGLKKIFQLFFRPGLRIA